MKTLQEQIAELKANPNVGGVVWEIDRMSNWTTLTHKYKTLEFYAQVTHFHHNDKLVISIDGHVQKTATSTTLNEALLEALDIVKAKVKELAKELGLVCFDKEQVEVINNLVKDGMENYFDSDFDKIQQLQQYLRSKAMSEKPLKLKGLRIQRKIVKETLEERYSPVCVFGRKNSEQFHYPSCATYEEASLIYDRLLKFIGKDLVFVKNEATKIFKELNPVVQK